MDYNKDYYGILEVEKNATQETLKSAYRRLAKLHHPDKSPGDPGAEGRFKLINEAHEVLSSEITRHIYDEYRENYINASAEKKSEKEEEKVPETEKTKPKTSVSTRTVKREKRIYVVGTIQIKFQGEPELTDFYMMQWERDFKIHPTETLVTINSSGIYKDGAPREYERAYSSAELFATPLRQPLNCRIMTSAGEEYYLITVHDIKIKSPVIKDVTRHEQYSYGTLEGDFYGYVVYTYDEEVTELVTEQTGPTGKVETKEEAGVYFTREEYFNKDGGPSWTEWRARPEASKIKKTASGSSSPKIADSNNSWIFWMIAFVLGFLIWPKLFFGILFFWGSLFLLYLLISLLPVSGRLMTLLGTLFILFIIFRGAKSFLNTTAVTNTTVPAVLREIQNQKTAVNNNSHDTLISHKITWSDYDSNKYTVSLAILQSAVTDSRQRHAGLGNGDLPRDEPAGIYDALLKMDAYKMEYVDRAFDSIRIANKLSERQTAKMIVSCVQSIPYFLVLDKSCADQYADQYISNYLSKCLDDCCIGNIKFGVQSPAEFISDLKGDCDTRALILYDLLAKQGINVALMTSEFYKHAMIAVHFKNEEIPGGLSVPIGDNNYYMWETTSGGNRPGEVAPAVRNLQYWDITLLHQ